MKKFSPTFPAWRWTEVFGPAYVFDEIELGFRVALWLAEENSA